MSICYPMVIPAAAGGSFDAATTAWINAVVAAGGTVSDTQKSRVDALIVGLKADSLFSANSRLWIHAGESVSQQATIDILALAVASPVSSPALGASGYTGDGSADYVDLGSVPSNFTKDSNSFGVYNLKDSTSVNNDVLMGVSNGGAELHDLLPQQSAGNALARASSNSTLTGASANRKGMYVVTRSAETASALYRNGTSIDTDATGSNATATLNFFILARNDSGSPALPGIDIIGASWIGSGLDATQAGNLTTRIETYLDAWGVLYDVATTAWINAVVAAGGTVSTTQKRRVDALIVGLKADSLFSANSRLWLHAGESISQQATIDIMGLAVATPTNPSLGASGYTGNSSNRFIDLGTLPSNFTQNSLSLGCYNLLNSTTIDNTIMIGLKGNGDKFLDLLPRQGTDNGLFARANANTAASAASANRNGMLLVVRRDAGTGGGGTARATSIYRNGALLDDTDTTSDTIPAFNMYTLARNEAGTATSFSSDIAGASWLGPLLSDAQAANLSTRINTYMTAWSINVY